MQNINNPTRQLSAILFHFIHFTKSHVSSQYAAPPLSLLLLLHRTRPSIRNPLLLSWSPGKGLTAPHPINLSAAKVSTVTACLTLPIPRPINKHFYKKKRVNALLLSYRKNYLIMSMTDERRLRFRHRFVELFFLWSYSEMAWSLTAPSVRQWQCSNEWWMMHGAHAHGCFFYVASSSSIIKTWGWCTMIGFWLSLLVHT